MWSPLTPPQTLNRPIAPSRKRLRIESDRNLPILSSPLISSQSVVSQIDSNDQSSRNIQITSALSLTTSNTNNNVAIANSLTNFSDIINTERTIARNDSASQTESPNYNALLAIFSKYFTSHTSLAAIISKIESLSTIDSLRFNDLMMSITSSARPIPEVRLQIIRELQESGIVTLTEFKKSWKLQKGPNFQ